MDVWDTLSFEYGGELVILVMPFFTATADAVDVVAVVVDDATNVVDGEAIAVIAIATAEATTATTAAAAGVGDVVSSSETCTGVHPLPLLVKAMMTSSKHLPKQLHDCLYPFQLILAVGNCFELLVNDMTLSETPKT